MGTDPTSASPGQEAARRYARAARSAATLKAYEDDWRDFTAWCAVVGEAALPAEPETIGRFLADRAGTLKPSTLEGRLSAIFVRHRQAGFYLDRRHSAIADVLAGIRRTLGTAPAQKAALSVADLQAMVVVQPATLLGMRDRALLTLGFAGAFRRSELAALTIADLVFTSEGVAVVVRRGKEDQEARSSLRGLPFGQDATTCPVRTVRTWMMAAGLAEGPLFRRIDRHGNLRADGISGAAVALVVKRAVRLAGEQLGWSRTEIARQVAAVAGHSLRAGLITAAAQAGATELQIMQHPGHKSGRALRGYVRQGELFQANVVTRLGL